MTYKSARRSKPPIYQSLNSKVMIGRMFGNDNNVRNAVIRSLRHYYLFEYPLTAEEIYGILPFNCSFSTFLVALEDLDDEAKIFKYEGYYSLDPDVRKLVVRRKVTYN